MKGVVFTEFLTMVEEVFSYDIADKIIEACDLSTGGAYTSVGTYDHSELVDLVTALSNETSTDIADLIKTFGVHLFGRFYANYGEFFKNTTTTYDFLMSVESYIHVEVLKLYPDAELPTFTCRLEGDSTLYMVYKSKRPFADLAEGLIMGCANHFGENINVSFEDLSDGEKKHAQFTLTKAA